jgi:hypothetical protein
MSKRFIGMQRMNAPDPMAAFLDAADPIYGTGFHGNAVLDGGVVVLADGSTLIPDTTNTFYGAYTDLYFNNLTIEPGIQLRPDGYRIFVKNILTLGNGSRIGFTTGFSTAGSIAQGGGIAEAVTNSLGGAGLINDIATMVETAVTATAPTAALGGAKYYAIPHQAVRGWAATASTTTPTFVRGGAGGLGEPGGGVVIIAARHITVSSGTAVISAPATAPAGGGVIFIVSSHSALPAGLSTDVTGQNPGTVNYMQLV